MGVGITSGAFTRDDRTRYRHKIRRCLDVLTRMLDDLQFDSDHMTTGLELEINLIDEFADPAMINDEVLAGLADHSFQPELGKFNIEFNARPREIADQGFDDYEADMLSRLGRLGQHAAKSDADIVLVGILPTMTEQHTVLENLSPRLRYRELNTEIMEASGADLNIDIRGPEHLRTSVTSIAPEAACTSVQFHMQLGPEAFPNYWNAAQSIAGVQLALGANSPYVYGRELWAETRIALFEQATDTRPEEMKNQGVRQRVWFGERWITSILDLFAENARYFPPLLPICDAEDPQEVFDAGGVPRLSELRLQNGTVYRWNRPVYDIMDSRPHLRLENRTLPAGPTVVDIFANAALYFGLVRELADADRPVWTSLTFSQAEANFYIGARDGIAAQLFWPRFGEIDATRLVLDHLLPKAYAGLDSFGVGPQTRDRLLGIIEGRCHSRRNGATWQTETVHAMEASGASRTAALRDMLLLYADHLTSNIPVHLWERE